jgi:AbrB family looped-hinge helix DNA binding protein
MRDIPEVREEPIQRIEVGKQGRFVIPADVRRKLGIEEGTELAVLIQDHALVLITREGAKRRLREMFAGSDRSLSEELIAEHHAEAEAEAAAELAARRDRARRP